MSKPVARFRFFRSAWLAAGILLGFSVQAWAYSGDTIQDDIAREFNGATSYTIPLTPPAQTTSTSTNCETTLQQENQAGEVPSNEECYCPVGATQPVCSVLPSSDCQDILTAEQERMGSSYDCTCPTGATSPQCTSYYDLCENNLPYYQNSTDECSCSQSATSAVPECTSNYQICEDNAGQYENGSTTCSCSQYTTEPTCCKSTTTEVPSTVATVVPGISAGVSSSAVSVYCADSSMPTESTGYGPACPGSSGITTCYQGICRTWMNTGGSMYGGPFSGGGTYQPTGSYWDWGYCDGPNSAGSCGASGGWFTIYFGPSGYTGPDVITYAPSYTEYSTVYNPVTTQSCTQEPG